MDAHCSPPPGALLATASAAKGGSPAPTSAVPAGATPRVTCSDGRAPLRSCCAWAMGARYEPRARTEWERRVPDDVDSLFLARRIVRVDAQVRLEPTWATERALSPVGSDGRRSERLDEHSLPLGRVVSRLAEPDWDGLPAGGARTRLTATPTTVMVPANSLPTY